MAKRIANGQANFVHPNLAPSAIDAPKMTTIIFLKCLKNEA
jgi:hypothetical protein